MQLLARVAAAALAAKPFTVEEVSTGKFGAGGGRAQMTDRLSQAGASLSDIVSVRQWLASEEDVRAYVEVRSKFITHKPAALLGVIPSLVRPDFLIEIEVVAAVPAGKVKGPSNQPYPETPSAR